MIGNKHHVFNKTFNSPFVKEDKTSGDGATGLSPGANTLSDKIIHRKFLNLVGAEVLMVEDVREFIKKLKDDLHLNISTSPLVTRIIDELAGEELT